MFKELLSRYYSCIPGTASIMRCFLASDIAAQTQLLLQDPTLLLPSIKEIQAHATTVPEFNQEGLEGKGRTEPNARASFEKEQLIKSLQSCQKAMHALNKLAAMDVGHGSFSDVQGMLSGFMNMMQQHVDAEQ